MKIFFSYGSVRKEKVMNLSGHNQIFRKILLISCCTGLFTIFIFTPSVFAWRSDMFPINWQPVDKAQIKSTDPGVDPTRVNIFYDVKGTQDQNGTTVPSTDPRYHPYRFLHDWSYAGYHKGERPIPPEDPTWTPQSFINILTDSYPGKASCTTDGKTNCTPTIQAAINHVAGLGGGVVYIPEGEFRISRTNGTYFLTINQSNVVLRGAGSDKTKLKVNPYTVENFNINSTTNFSMNGNTVFLVYPNGGDTDYGWDNLGNIKSINKDLPFPTTVIPLNDVTGFDLTNNNQIIIYAYYNDGDDNSFVKEHDMEQIWGVPGETPEAYMFRRTITAIDTVNKTITIDVPTRYRIKVTDKPQVALTTKGISEVGLEHFSMGVIRHPDDWNYDEQKVRKENWQNYLIKFVNVSNGWIYDVKTYTPPENVGRSVSAAGYTYDINYLNHGVYLKHDRFVTIKDLHLKNCQMNGHGNGNGYSFTVFADNEVLLEDSLIELVKKGFAFNRQSSGNVVKDLTTRKILYYQNDSHSNLSMANLIDNLSTDVIVEAAVRPIGAERSGDPNDSTYHGHGTTQTVFWNTKGLKQPTVALANWDKENATSPDIGIIASNQYGWGEIIGTSGVYSNVVTARMPNRRDTTSAWRPYILPEDYEECISYDVNPIQGAKDCSGSLEPRSLYEAQLALRLGTTPPPPPPPPPVEENAVVIDNLDPAPAFIKNGTGWVTSLAAGAYNGNSEYSKTLNDSASWNASLPAGTYEVHTWWTQHANRAIDAIYKIFNGTTKLDEKHVNQTTAGGQWNLLGEYYFDKGAKVELTVTTADLSHSADAVKFVLKPPPEFIIDNQDASGYVETGTGWVDSLAPDPYNGESRYSKVVGDKAAWSTTFPSGTYEVYAWWTEHENRAISASYKVYDGMTFLAEKFVNQTQGGGQWNLLGKYYFNGLGGKVELTVTTADLSHSTDAVKFMQVPTPPDTTPPSIPVVTDEGQYSNNSTSIFASWSSTDLESGIAEYQYKITGYMGSPVIRDWTSAGTDTSVSASGLILQNGQTYYVMVKARNIGGLWSDIGYSDGITIDTTAPSLPTVTDAGAYTGSTTQLTASWSSSDTESGMSEYQYQITQDTTAGTVIRAWTSTGITASVTATGLTLVNGKKYYFSVKGKNRAGLWSSVGYSDGITVDNTAPATPVVTDGGTTTTSTTQLTASWSSTDTGSGISEYQYQITQDTTAGTVIRAWTSTGTTASVTASGLTLVNGKKYYFSVKAKNGAGLWSSIGYSDGITVVDNTAPTTPVVTDSGTYTASTVQLTASWSSSDAESGISEYQYQITQDTTAGTVIRAWTSTGTTASVTASGLTLVNGKKYYFAVKAKNGALLWSSVGYSDGITVDNTAPTTAVVTDGGTTTTSTTQLTASWSSTDTGSGISEYQYQITQDTTAGTVIRAWTSTGTTASVTASGLTLVDGKKYYFAVKAKNGAGLWSSIGYSDGITVVVPVEKIVDNKDAGFTKVGTWTVSQAPNPYPIGTGDSLYSNTVGNTATWTLASLPSGTYKVYAWWTSTSNRTTSASYKLFNSSSATTPIIEVFKDQTTAAGGGGKWNYLGDVTITAGSGKVVLTVKNTQYHSADAIRFVK